jgi:ADP-heptose:LPS heptosyltransferase
LKEYLAGKHAVDYAIAPVNYFESMSFQTKQTKSEELSLRAKRSKYEELSLRAKRSNLSVISVPVNLKPILEIPEIILNKFNYLSKISDKKILLVNISAGKIARQLETEKWIDIILSLQKNLFTGIISTKKDFHKAELICNKTYAEYIKAINIYEVASVVSYSDIVLSTDTSLIHIASALNKPVIGLFDNVEWNINKFYPLSDIKEVLISDNPENLKSITTEEIIKSVNGILYKISN